MSRFFLQRPGIIACFPKKFPSVPIPGEVSRFPEQFWLCPETAFVRVVTPRDVDSWLVNETIYKTRWRRGFPFQ